jgi:hypothetical protein
MERGFIHLHGLSLILEHSDFFNLMANQKALEEDPNAFDYEEH